MSKTTRTDIPADVTEAMVRFVRLAINATPAIASLPEAQPMLRLLSHADIPAALPPLDMDDVQTYLRLGRARLDEDRVRMKERERAIQQFKIEMEKECKALAKRIRSIPKIRVA
ncbi:hypothetical protein K0U83_15575 [bacterium]|nr:hypothetical protein [bacterium]